jgi:hypothetical protein
VVDGDDWEERDVDVSIVEEVVEIEIAKIKLNQKEITTEKNFAIFSLHKLKYRLKIRRDKWTVGVASSPEEEIESNGVQWFERGWSSINS